MKNKIIKTIENKEIELQNVLCLYDDHNNNKTEKTLREIEKIENDIKSQISILRYLLSECCLTETI